MQSNQTIRFDRPIASFAANINSHDENTAVDKRKGTQK